MKTLSIPFENTALDHKLISAYLKNDKNLKEYYDHMPDPNAIPEIIIQRKKFNIDRHLLTEVLQKQYFKVKKPHQNVIENINKLKNENTYTVTTGHQPNIFSGPLYFWYKITDTINYSNYLNKKHPGFHFVPLYWMATEDHDFAEINHIHVFGNTYTWNNDEKGAIGKMSTLNIQKIIKELIPKLSQNEYGTELIEIFSKAYTGQNKLADASRYWIDKMLGHTGLIVLDPDNPDLKQKLIPVIVKDVIENEYESLVKSVKTKLEIKYPKLPVNPRKINFFYLDKSRRERIVFKNNKYNVLHTRLSFSENEMVNLIHDQPEKFSPNVIMRPMYQELILPNITYFGGTTEIAYWLELKDVFKVTHIFYPQLMVRNSVFWLGKTLSKNISKSVISSIEMLTSKEKLDLLILKRLNKGNDIESFINGLIGQYNVLKNGNLPENIRAEIGKKAAIHQKELKNIRKTVNSAIKKENSLQIEKLNKYYNTIFPEGIPQERYDNFIPYYLKYGKKFIDILKDELPVGGGNVIVIEDD